MRHVFAPGGQQDLDTHARQNPMATRSPPPGDRICKRAGSSFQAGCTARLLTLPNNGQCDAVITSSSGAAMLHANPLMEEKTTCVLSDRQACAACFARSPSGFRSPARPMRWTSNTPRPASSTTSRWPARTTPTTRRATSNTSSTRWTRCRSSSSMCGPRRASGMCRTAARWATSTTAPRAASSAPTATRTCARASTACAPGTTAIRSMSSSSSRWSSRRVCSIRRPASTT